MKLLLDEMMPVDLRHHLAGHDVYTVAFMGWKSKRNGELMQLMVEHGFEAMITNDRQMRDQHAPAWVRVPIIVTHLPNPKLEHMLTLVSGVLSLLSSNPPPGFHHVHFTAANPP